MGNKLIMMMATMMMITRKFDKSHNSCHRYQGRIETKLGLKLLSIKRPISFLALKPLYGLRRRHHP